MIMDYIEKEALSISEAVFAAALALGIDEKEAQVQVLSAPGVRRVKVRVGRPGAVLPSLDTPTMTPTAVSNEAGVSQGASRAPQSHERPASTASFQSRGERLPPSAAQAESLRADMEQLLILMGTPSKVELKAHAGNTVLNLSGEFEGLLIGKRGATLDALQTVALQMLSTATGNHDSYVVVDVADYRTRQERKLMDKARELANQALADGQEQVMGSLSPAERRVVHLEIKSMEGVESFSVGSGSTKKVVIKKKG
jgi:spoIIIJ-associated protein